MSEKQEIQIRKTTLPIASFEPETYAELNQFVDMICESNMVPKAHCTKEGKPIKGNLKVSIIMGRSLGVPALQAIQNICVINGMPSVWGDLALALVKTHPSYIDVIEEPIPGGWKCTSKRKGVRDVVRTFTMEDARKAKLDGKDGPWKLYPDRMCQMRARVFSIRDQFPDALRGLRIAEEIMDIEAEVIEPSDSPADRLRAAKAAKENGTPPVEQPNPVEQKPASNGADADAVMILKTIMKQLGELGYKATGKEREEIKALSTEEAISKKIDYYEKKLVELSEANGVLEEPPDYVDLPKE